MKELSRIVADMITRDSENSRLNLEEQSKKSKLLGNTNGKCPIQRNWNQEIPYPGRGGIIGDQNLTSVDYRMPQELFRDPMIVM